MPGQATFAYRKRQWLASVEPVTARQSLTASLSRDPDLAARPDHLMTLVDDILLDLQDNRLTVVASSECDDEAEVLGRARPDRPTGW